MKKLVLFLGLLIAAYSAIGQATNVAEYRIANATTAFGVNIPVGTKVYNMATQEYFVCITASASTLNLTTGTANFKKLNAIEVVDETVGASWNGQTTVAGSKDDIHDYILIGDTDLDGKTNVLDIGAGLVKTDANGVVSTAVAGTDYVATEVDGSVTNEGILGVGAGAANTATITSNTSTANPVTIAVSGGGLAISETTNTNGGTITITSTSGLTKTEAFEEDDATPTAHTLTSTAITANGARVSLNGATLKPSQYTLTSTTLTIAASVPVLQYDQVVVTYY